MAFDNLVPNTSSNLPKLSKVEKKSNTIIIVPGETPTPPPIQLDFELPIARPLSSFIRTSISTSLAPPRERKRRRRKSEIDRTPTVITPAMKIRKKHNSNDKENNPNVINI